MQRFIEQCREAGDVLDIHAEVDPEFEAAAITAEVQARGNQIVVFHRLRGYDMPVATNIYGCRHRLERILGVAAGSGDSVSQALNRHIERSVASRSSATSQAGESSGRQACRLSQIPLLRYHEEDAGRYLTAG
ncbi:MAG: hypothetical protein AB7E55_18385, partial [Pigmentiphaga sp.]